jgi:hypothetical protein
MAGYYQWRFGVVLVAALLLVAVQPVLSGILDERSSFDAFFSLLIVAVLVSLVDERRRRLLGSALAIAAISALWLGDMILTANWLVLMGHLFAAAFFGLALTGILRAIFQGTVTGDAIFGAICGYLLLGIIWGIIYSALETVSPGSFQTNDEIAATMADPRHRRGLLNYYSFVTLTTVGYGDILPASPVARTLAWLEAMTGQIYLAVLVAGLVGLKVSQSPGVKRER